MLPTYNILTSFRNYTKEFNSSAVIPLLCNLNLTLKRYPSYTPVLQRAVELWYHEPSVTTPLLKLFTELAQNR